MNAPARTHGAFGKPSPAPRWPTPPRTAAGRWPPFCGASPPRPARRCSRPPGRTAPCWCWNRPIPARSRPTGAFSVPPLSGRSTPFCRPTASRPSSGRTAGFDRIPFLRVRTANARGFRHVAGRCGRRFSFKIRRRRRTCADDGDTSREILRQECARPHGSSARFAVKFCRRGIQRAAEPSAACGGCSEAEQGQRSQSTSAAPRRAVRCGYRDPLNRRVRRRRSPA